MACVTTGKRRSNVPRYDVSLVRQEPDDRLWALRAVVQLGDLVADELLDDLGRVWPAHRGRAELALQGLELGTPATMQVNT